MPNLSQIKRKRMLEFLQKIKEEHKNDDEMLIALGEIESELNAKKYGLVWEEHEEKVDVQMRTQIPVFTEVKEREISAAPEKPYNFLLEGDNLHSLYLLEKTHKGAIDLIYIDPPYNTGNKDFVYDDAFVVSEDTFRHSKWLSFMKKRLRIAAELLSENGLIFVSIDDNEQAVLKILMDDIFSEENFIIMLPRVTKKSGKTTGSFSKNHDYVLVYTKRNKNIFAMQEHTDEDFKFEDEWVEERGRYKLNQTLDYDSLSYSASLDYPLKIENEVFYPGADKAKWEERRNGNYKRADWAWRWNPKLVEFGYKNGFIVIKRKSDGSARLYTKTYLNATIEKNSYGEYYIKQIKRTKAMSSVHLIENSYSNDNAKKDLALFGLKDKFDYSKPVELIKRLIENHFNKNAVVLDFFAGSGTTAQAVLELNKKDGGQREFILCTDNQNSICEQVTYSRIADIINGNDKYVAIPANLKYYRTDFVPRDEEYLSDALLEHIAEMIQLEHGVKIDGSQYRMIMSDAEADLFFQNAEEIATVKALYISKNVLLTTEQREKLNGAEIHIIPDDYFLFELKEEAHV